MAGLNPTLFFVNLLALNYQKVWWPDATLFASIFFYMTFIVLFLHLFVLIPSLRFISISLAVGSVSQWAEPSWGCWRAELWPAVKQYRMSCAALEQSYAALNYTRILGSCLLSVFECRSVSSPPLSRTRNRRWLRVYIVHLVILSLY